MAFVVSLVNVAPTDPTQIRTPDPVNQIENLNVISHFEKPSVYD